MDKANLKIIHSLPKGFLDIAPENITEIISCPTILYLKKESAKEGKAEEKGDRPLFLSILLHGNEFSGLKIAQEVLKKYESQKLPGDLIVFVGNPQACAGGERHLPGQLDFNRVWSGGDSEEHRMAQAVLRYAKEQKIRAAVDIHNNSGRNPIYACISETGEEYVKLAQAFSENVVYFMKPDSVLSRAFSELAPSIVMECGLPGAGSGLAAGSEFLEKLWRGDEFWRDSAISIPHVYWACAKLVIDPAVRVSFSPDQNLPQSLPETEDLRLIDRFDQLNFKLIPAGAVLGKAGRRLKIRQKIKLTDEGGRDIFDQVFSVADSRLTVKSPFIPSMFTKDIKIAKSDCLGYIMRKIPVNDFLSGRFYADRA